MAFQIGNGSGDDDPVLSDINVTPLVDVMLVLLIIFMITAPMLHQGIQVALPRANAENLPMRTEDPLVLSIDREGALFVRDTPVTTEDLVDNLRAELDSPDDTVFLKADREIAYGRVVEVLDLLHRGGIVNVGMVTERLGEEGGRRGRS
ncbi:MAG TPA: ExbD/TolR family protein [Thermoanaerobaculia bacterium]|nr:ExbD/TolR family protein [Thermoanaerobaculia bacterium]